MEYRNNSANVKKRDMKDCKNYRSRTLIGMPTKELTRMLQKRLREKLETTLENLQTGEKLIRKGRIYKTESREKLTLGWNDKKGQNLKWGSYKYI